MRTNRCRHPCRESCKKAALTTRCSVPCVLATIPRQDRNLRSYCHAFIHFVWNVLKDLVDANVQHAERLLYLLKILLTTSLHSSIWTAQQSGQVKSECVKSARMETQLIVVRIAAASSVLCASRSMSARRQRKTTRWSPWTSCELRLVKSVLELLNSALLLVTESKGSLCTAFHAASWFVCNV